MSDEEKEEKKDKKKKIRKTVLNLLIKKNNLRI